MSGTSATSNEQRTELVVRKMPFQFPDDIHPHWNQSKPEWSHIVNGASLALPYLEPHLIRTMRKAMGEIDSGNLR